ncbi:hypothetical protein BOSEA31B_14905 [Hyphomicrobiales bacterium]|nr:hypothetical protein BOSEA31B_14905 [Hyphomicrobiales bacterium]
MCDLEPVWDLASDHGRIRTPGRSRLDDGGSLRRQRSCLHCNHRPDLGKAAAGAKTINRMRWRGELIRSSAAPAREAECLRKLADIFHEQGGLGSGRLRHVLDHGRHALASLNQQHIGRLEILLRRCGVRGREPFIGFGRLSDHPHDGPAGEIANPFPNAHPRSPERPVGGFLPISSRRRS